MITKYIVGDITETPLRYIAHGVNCQNVMGSGVAKALFTKWWEVKARYHGAAKRARLGLVQRVDRPTMTIFNCYTQDQYGYDGKRYVNYAAIVECFFDLKNQFETIPMSERILAIPKIGCGLAGGDWKIVEQLINDTVGDDLEIWVYELEPTKYSKQNGAPT